MAISPNGWDVEVVGCPPGSAEAVFFLRISFTSVQTPGSDDVDSCKRCRVARGEPWFYLRLGKWSAGLTLIRVLRGCLWLESCLGVTDGRANVSLETGPRTQVPDPEAVGKGNAPHQTPRGVRALARLHRQQRWIVAFSCFPKS